MFKWLVLFSLSFLLQAREVSLLLSEIPPADRTTLDLFFQALFREDPFAYTLFGEKPMSIADYCTSDICLGEEERKSRILEKGWVVWESYRYLFPSEIFVLKRKKTSQHHHCITLLNKRQALKIIRANFDLYCLANNNITKPEDILRELCKEDPALQIGRQDQIGVLLGFGRHNATHFRRMVEIGASLRAKLTPPFFFSDEIDRLTPEYKEQSLSSSPIQKSDLRAVCPSTLEDESFELNRLLEKKSWFHLPGSEFVLDFTAVPAFADFGESPELVESYGQTRRQIHRAYQEGSFLEVTLKQWMDP